MSFSRETVRKGDGIPGAAQLKAGIERLLQARGIDEIEHLEIAVSGRSVVLSGVIADRERQRRCAECCRHVAGVAEVIDQLKLNKAEFENTHPQPKARK